MTDYRSLAQQLEASLGLEQKPVAMAFAGQPPENVPHVATSGPASCSYWKMAGDGQTFYTTATDHLNCTIGAYTHGVAMPEEKSAELQATIGQMVGLNYLKMEEVAQIPHRTAPFDVAVYSPLAESPGDPDVVIVRANARQVMLLTEACMAAGAGPEGGVMARPTCAFIPGTIESGRGTPSFACIGNRVYTGLGDHEIYFAIPGAKLAQVAAELEKIVEANRALEGYHQQRMASA